MKEKSLLLPIFLTVFIDMLGIGIIIPVLPALFFESSSDFFNGSISYEDRSIIYGFLLAAFPIMQFFGAPILGALSDHHGRKPMLMVSLAGTMIGYFLFAIALMYGNLWLLIFSRMLPGFTGGNISIVYSAIADISEGSERTKNFGFVGMAFGLGFILGPAIGGFLADESIVFWFNSSTPFWFTTILTLVNILLVQALFFETLKEKGTRAVSFLTGFKNIAYSFKMPNLRVIFAVSLLLTLGFAFFTQFFAVTLIDKFSFSESDIGLFYAWVGIWLVITQGFLVPILAKKYASSTLLKITIFTLGASIFLVIFPENVSWEYAIAPFIAFSQGISAPNLISVISNQASASQQGQILGINQSMQSLGAAIPPIIGGYLTAMNSLYPLMASAAVIFLSWLVYVVFFKEEKAIQMS
ncbi:MAG: DHA1 family tetracycline resistance protein-like MFS transporter [Saprospiraceae bacterium]|jgi:DHA1 family tetracycline resistance protein-like MFS transporter